MKLVNVKWVLMVIFVLCAVFNAQAQADPQYTQYMYNTINVNPAYAGSRGVMSIFGLHRAQWVGLDGAPKTTSLSIHSPLGDSRLGFGVSFINDNIGVMDENNISLDLSYTMDLNRKFKLSFGLKGTANLLNVDYDKLNIHDLNDVVFSNNINHQFTPNIGAGLYLRSDKTYMGISVPNFLATDRFDNNTYTAMRQKVNFYLIAGHVFDLSAGLKFKPAILTKAVAGAPVQIDASANFLIADVFTIGAAYRWDAAVSGLLGFQLTEGLFVGYSYDAETSKLVHYNSGSHEIYLRFELFRGFNRITSPRFF